MNAGSTSAYRHRSHILLGVAYPPRLFPDPSSKCAIRVTADDSSRYHWYTSSKVQVNSVCRFRILSRNLAIELIVG